MSTIDYRGPFAQGTALLFVLVLAWLLYAPGLSGDFLLDDLPNLSGLASVSDASSAVQFAFTGDAGPTGRPLSLASFALQADDWGGSARPFLIVNVLLHIVNGLLAWGFFLQLARALSIEQRDARLIALAALSLWLFMPLLASSTLMVIQRMTTLAAFWMLAGLNAYLLFRQRLDSAPRAALAGMTLALGLATLLAVLSKENGALLPALVLVIEGVLLTRPGAIASRTWRAWQTVVLGVPTVVILALLAARVPYDPATVGKWDFTGWQRLLTDARVLWDYALNAALPRVPAFGPFHDNVVVSRSLLEPAAFLAVAAWLAAIGAAIAFRRRYPLFAFGVLWFLAGHLLESTTVPLFLYFEHRNYVPMLGPVFALAVALFSVSGRLRLAARLLLPVYAVLNAVILFGVTSTWGQPALAAQVWSRAAPDSAGATSFYVQQQIRSGDIAGAIISLRNFADAYPDHAYLGLPALNLSCSVLPAEDHAAEVATLRSGLAAMRYGQFVASQLDQLYVATRDGACKGVDTVVVRELAETVFENPRYGSVDAYATLHYQLLARVAFAEGDTAAALANLETARRHGGDLELDARIVSVLVTKRDFDAARAEIERAASELPLHPFRRTAAKKMLEEFERYVAEAEAAEP